jgi:hypothetical protein
MVSPAAMRSSIGPARAEKAETPSQRLASAVVAKVDVFISEPPVWRWVVHLFLRLLYTTHDLIGSCQAILPKFFPSIDWFLQNLAMLIY